MRGNCVNMPVPVVGLIYEHRTTRKFVLLMWYNFPMEERLDTKEEFSLLKRARSFTHAGRGIKVFFITTHNAWIHAVFCVGVVFLGFYFGITNMEWIALIIVSGLVFATEAVNTAIEIDINLTSPEYHPYARDTKDVAAGAVLIASVTAVFVGVVIFAPYIL